MQKRMQKSAWKGLSFGLVSSVITTLGMLVGVDAGTNSKIAVLASIVAIAIADSFSDAFSIHVSEEAEGKTSKEVKEATLFAFFSKFFFAMSFTIPILTLKLQHAVVVSVLWGLTLIIVFSYINAGYIKRSPFKEVVENVVVTLAVITVTYFTGKVISNLLKG